MGWEIDGKSALGKRNHAQGVRQSGISHRGHNAGAFSLSRNDQLSGSTFTPSEIQDLRRREVSIAVGVIAL